MFMRLFSGGRQRSAARAADVIFFRSYFHLFTRNLALQSHNRITGRRAACVYNSRMNIPDRIVSLAELRRNNGDLGRPKFIAYAGVVYDVSDCPRWRADLHERLHFPGQDLSGEMAEAPHRADVLNRPCVRVVGRLEETRA